MSVGVTRSINVTTTEDDLERAMQARIAGRRRIDRLANRPDGPSARDLSDAELRASALYGPPDVIAAKVQALRDVGVEYLLVNSAGGIRSLRRFAHEIMPAFSGSPVLDAADCGARRHRADGVRACRRAQVCCAAGAIAA